MQSFTFDELSERAQMSIIHKYGPEVGSYSYDDGQEFLTIPPKAFDTWRFTEHGERIA